jgi:hypothetical protein
MRLRSQSKPDQPTISDMLMSNSLERKLKTLLCSRQLAMLFQKLSDLPNLLKEELADFTKAIK